MYACRNLPQWLSGKRMLRERKEHENTCDNVMLCVCEDEVQDNTDKVESASASDE